MIRKLYSLFIKHINDIGIHTKLLTFFFLVSIIPFFLMTLINYKTVASETQHQTLYTANIMFNQNLTLLQNYINSIMDVSGTISLDRNVIQSVLKSKPPEYFSDYVAQNDHYLRMTNYISGFQKYEYINRLILYVSGSYIFSDQNHNFYNLDKVKNHNWYNEVMTSKDQLIWFSTSSITGKPADIEYISIIRKVRNLDYVPQILALLRIDIEKSLINNLISTSITTPNSKVIILNSKNEIICSSEDSSSLVERSNLNYNILASQSKDNETWYKIKAGKDKYWYMSNDIPKTDWKVLLMIPSSDLLSASDKSRNNMVLIALFTSLAAYGLAYVFSLSLTKRMMLLIKHMKKIETGNFNIEIMPQSKDEVGQLIKNFNFMSSEISTLMDEKYRIGKEMKSAELRALQAQINPHFLYNTLDLIHWRALSNNAPQISKLVKALAKYYKLVLSRGEDTVPLENEFEHVKTYVQIQNERFQNRIHLTTQIHENLKSYMVPKLLLQPLIENAILHGIMEKTEMEGTISIAATSNGVNTVITIEDNGVGMTESRCQSILSCEASDKGSGYGIRNINDRIQLYYGKDFGIYFESNLGSGTKVIIKLPPRT
jgi:two-component system, sensor histidine kinase YesM